MFFILKCLLGAALVLLISCTKHEFKGEELQKENKQMDSPEMIKAELQVEPKQVLIDKEGKTVENRILPPEGFTRISVEKDSYAEYLRKLPLKPYGSPVLYYNGAVKSKENVYMAVVDMEIGDRDLQQCSDAIMRLRGEYLYKIGAYDRIHFNFTNGFRVDYQKWMEGYRVVIEGNQTDWKKTNQATNTYQNFRSYMDIIFAYAGTLSLDNELTPVNLEEMQIGDVFIQGGSPGHAVVVIDMVVDEVTGEKLFLLAQSYMPAQDIQVLVNPNDTELNPWYSLDTREDNIYTPEWTFTKENLKRFPYNF